MATQPCPNIAQVTLELESDGQKIQNDYYFAHAGGWSAGDMQTLGDAFRSAAVTHLPGKYCGDVTFIRVVATDLTSLAGERYVTQFAPGTVGTVGGQSSPNSVALALEKSTGNRGKGQ